MNPGQFRQLLRFVHLGLGVIAATALYIPVVTDQIARVTVAIIVPLIVLTGVAMWQQAKLRKLFRRPAPHRGGAT